MEIYLKTRLPFGSTGLVLHSSLSIPFDVAEVYGFLSDIKIKNKFNDLGRRKYRDRTQSQRVLLRKKI